MSEDRAKAVRKGLSRPADLFSAIGDLPDAEREVMLCIYREGRATFVQLVRETGIERDGVARALATLAASQLVFRYAFHNFEFYELNLRRTRALTYERFPSGPVIPLIYHFNLLCNEARTEAFAKAIRAVVKPGDTVFDLGCGTGILSLFAAQQGANVVAIEVDPIVAEAAEYFVKTAGFSNNVKVIQADVRETAFHNVADVVVCELLDTAMIAELQVPVMNFAVQTLLKPGGQAIPVSAETSAELVWVNYAFSAGLSFPIIHYEAHGARTAQLRLSAAIPYHSVNFGVENDLEFDGRFVLPVEETGSVNGLRLSTETWLTEDMSIDGSPWFNPPLVLPCEELAVSPGDQVEVRLSYGLGSGFSSIKYAINRQ